MVCISSEVLAEKLEVGSGVGGGGACLRCGGSLAWDTLAKAASRFLSVLEPFNSMG